MGRPHGPQRVYFQFSNPLRKIFRSSSVQNQTLLASLKRFESALSFRLEKLKPKNEDHFDMGWMRAAMAALLDTHTDVKHLITELGTPLIDWEEHWVNAYLDHSLKLLDMCNAFSSEISRLSQFHLLLRHALHSLEHQQPLEKALSSLHGWRAHHASSKECKLWGQKGFSDAMAETLNFLPKKHVSGKEKVMMRAMFGLNVFTVFVYRVFMGAFSGSEKMVLDFEVERGFWWAGCFNGLAEEVEGVVAMGGKLGEVKEVKRVKEGVEKMKEKEEEGGCCWETVVCELQKDEETLGRGIEGVREQVEEFFRIVFERREELLSCVRESCFGPPRKTSFKGL